MANRVWALGAGLAIVAGCAAANPFRLEDQVNLFHDDLRWGRLPAAEAQVDSHQRPAFVRRHAAWGRTVRIVDVEIQSTRVSGITGTVIVRYVWTRSQDVATRDTDVETRWRAGFDGNWVLDDEHVVAGDPTLLASR